MGYFDCWEYETVEFLNGFIESDLNANSVKDFLRQFDLSQYEISIDLKEAKRILLVYGNNEYSFSGKDLAWISDRTKAIVCNSQDRNLIFVELDSNRDTYYLDSSAFIKNFNKAFPLQNCYIFKTCNGLAVGSMRCFNESIANNFCVTQLFTTESMDLATDFIDEILFDKYDQIPTTIIDYSPQEKVDYIKTRNSNDEWDYVDEQIAIDFVDDPIIYTTYKEASDILKAIASDKNESSLDMLEDAIVTKEKSDRSEESSNRENEELPTVNPYSDLTEEQDIDAEELLKEILGKK